MTTEELKNKTPDELIALLQKANEENAQKDETIKQAVQEVAVLQLQKDTKGLPVISVDKKNYQSTVHTTTLPSKEGIYSEPTFIEIKKLGSKDKKIIDRLVKLGILVELK